MKRPTLVALLMLAAVVSPVMADSDAPARAGRTARPAADAGEPLSIDVYPRVATTGYVSVRLRVEPNALSRLMEVSWWSADGLGGSSRLEVDGERAAIRYELPIKRIDPGEYEVSAVLIRADGTRIRRTANVIVVGRGF